MSNINCPTFLLSDVVSIMLWVIILTTLLFPKRVFPKSAVRAPMKSFVETKTSDFLKYNTSILNDEIGLKHIKGFESFTPFLSSRQNEDTSTSLAYKTTIEKRFSNNSEAFVLFHKANPVGYIFIQKEKVTIPQVRTTFKHTKNSYSFIDLYIFKNSRGKKYHEILYFLTVKELSKFGFEHFWCWLMEHNQISIKAHVKIGIKNVTKIITRKSFLFFSVTRIKNQSICLSQLIRKSLK